MPRRMWYAAAAGWRSPAPSASRPPARPAGHRSRLQRRRPRSRIRDLDIEFYRARVARDPRSARDFTQLAGLYLQRARETADNEDLVRAEQTARHSLSLRRGRNEEASGVLASSLLGQHRFAEALEVARGLLAADSTSIAARGARGRDRARARTLRGGRRGSSGCWPVTRATWASRRDWPAGRSSAAGPRRRGGCCARRATRRRRRHGMPREQVAWFHLRLGRPGAPGRDSSTRPSASSRPGSRSFPAITGCSAPWRACTPSGTTGATRPTPASSPSPGRSIPPRSGCCTTPGPRSATRPKAERVLPRDGGRGAAPAGPVPPRVEPLPARPRPRGAAGPRQRRVGAPHAAGHLRLRSARLGAAQVGQGRRGPRADGARALARHARRDAVLPRRHDRPLARRHRVRARSLETALAINPSWHPSQPAEARAVLDSLAR